MRKIPRQISERLSAAADLFAEKGLNDSKIEDVAAVTGVPKATLYYYFPGKEHILAHLLSRTLRQMTVKLSAACLLYTSPSPRDRTRSRMPSYA